MMGFLKDFLLFTYATANHAVGMMYWVWIPGIVASAFLFTYIRPRIREAIIHGKVSGPGLLAGSIVAGISASAGRVENLNETRRWLSKGVRPSVALIHMVVSHNLVPYSLSITLLLMGLEFFMGQIIGTLIMAGLMASFAEIVPDRAWGGVESEVNTPPPQDAPRALTAALRYIASEFGRVWKGILAGLVLGGLIAAGGRIEGWPDLSTIGGGGMLAQIANAFSGPIISVVTLSSPVGNLFVAAFLWKSFALTYGGVVAFILASAANPRTVRGLIQAYGWRLGGFLALSLFLSAAIAGIAVVATFAAVGFYPSHTPLFHELVNRIMQTLSLTMGPM